MKTRHKKTCAVCGYPREVENHTEQCEEHCDGCRQPVTPGANCLWCCLKCGHYPCACAIIFDDDGHDGDGWTHCGDEFCDACNDHCSDVWCSECPNIHATMPSNHPDIPEGKTYTGMGDSGYATGKLAPPWEEAGVKEFPYHKAEMLYDSAEEAWPDMRCDEVDPVQRAADFYLLSAITSRCLNAQSGPDGTLPEPSVMEVLTWHPELTGAIMEAEMQLAELVDDTDRSFRAYIDMACGGELRHHNTVGGKHLNGNRGLAWIAWRSLREVRGAEALMDAYWLFNDFTKGGYGGPLWAGAAELLYKRLTGKITKTVFVDQTFSLVHNGGVFLNKKHWNVKNGKSLEYLRSYLLPAQARDDWQTMLDIASPATRQLWREGWVDLNKARVVGGARPTPVPGMESRKAPKCGFCGMNPRLGHRAFDCKDGRFVERVDRDLTRNSAYRYAFPSWSSDGKTLILYEGKYYGTFTSQRASAGRSLGGPLDKLLHMEREWKGLCRFSFNDQVIWQWAMAKPAKFTLAELLELHGVRIEFIANPNPGSEDEGPDDQESASWTDPEDDDDDWYNDDNE